MCSTTSSGSVIHTLVLTGLVIFANCFPDTYIYNLNDLESENSGEMVFGSFFDGYKLSSRALAQNLPLLNGLYVGILCTMALHGVLFYFQMWKPFQTEEDKREQEDENEEKGDKKEDDEKKADEEDGEDNDNASPSTFSPTLH